MIKKTQTPAERLKNWPELGPDDIFEAALEHFEKLGYDCWNDLQIPDCFVELESTMFDSDPIESLSPMHSLIEAVVNHAARRAFATVAMALSVDQEDFYSVINDWYEEPADSRGVSVTGQQLVWMVNNYDMNFEDPQNKYCAFRDHLFETGKAPAIPVESKKTIVSGSSPPDRRLERVRAAAHYFRVSEMTLWRWRQLPGFPQPLKAGRTRLYDIGAIEQWASSQEQSNK